MTVLTALSLTGSPADITESERRWFLGWVKTMTKPRWGNDAIYFHPTVKDKEQCVCVCPLKFDEPP